MARYFTVSFFFFFILASFGFGGWFFFLVFILLFFLRILTRKQGLHLKKKGARAEINLHVSKGRLVFQIILNPIRQETAISKVETLSQSSLYTLQLSTYFLLLNLNRDTGQLLMIS